MVPEFITLPGGSKWVQAQPAGASPSQPESAALPHNPQGILRIRRNQLLQSMAVDFVARTGGSRWLSALPTGGSKRVQAQPARRQQVDVGPADLPARRQEKRRRARNNNRQLT
ncbi:MAG: hypothetical protein SOT76_01180 [Eubacteriales bacterium]|nr:hypothetical protein [Eubacteriales bacterium]